MLQLRPIGWLIVSLCSWLLVPPAGAETGDPEDAYRACLAEVREEMLRSELKSLDPKVQEEVAGLCRRGDTEAAVLLAVPAAGPRLCTRRVSEAASRAEPKLSRDDVGRAYQLCRRGETDAALAIVEGASPAPEVTGPPVILSFEARREGAAKGGPVVLTWETENAGAVFLGRADRSEPSGMADRREVASSGSQTVRPSVTTTYRLQAHGMGVKSLVVGKRVTVQVEVAVSIFRFQARPPVVRRGEASRLTWDVYGTGDVSLDGEAVPARGENLVTPGRTTRYVLKAGSGRQVVEEASTVRVSPFPPMSLASPIRSIELCREVDRSGDADRCISSDGPFWAGEPVQVIVRFAELAEGEHHLEYKVFAGVPGSNRWAAVDRATGPFQHRSGRPAETTFEVPGQGKGNRKIEIVLDRIESTRSEVVYCVECPGHDEW